MPRPLGVTPIPATSLRGVATDDRRYTGFPHAAKEGETRPNGGRAVVPGDPTVWIARPVVRHGSLTIVPSSPPSR